MLGAFFYGCPWTQTFGGQLAERFGGKRVYAAGVLISAVLALLFPFAARVHVALLVAVRVMQGLSEVGVRRGEGGGGGFKRV